MKRISCVFSITCLVLIFGGCASVRTSVPGREPASDWNTAVSCENGSVRLDTQRNGYQRISQLVVNHGEAIRNLMSRGAINADAVNSRGEWIIALKPSDYSVQVLQGFVPRDAGQVEYQVTEDSYAHTLYLGVRYQQGNYNPNSRMFADYRFNGCTFH